MSASYQNITSDPSQPLDATVAPTTVSPEHVAQQSDEPISIYSWNAGPVGRDAGIPILRSWTDDSVKDRLEQENGDANESETKRKRSRPIRVRTLKPLKVNPKVIRVPLPVPSVRVKSFFFSPSDAPLQQESQDGDDPDDQTQDNNANKQRRPSGLFPTGGRRATRIRPPRDMVKLEDRLAFLLQPSLESILAEGQLWFPFQPFPYQMQGIAFLYPRHEAVLADEMGLGKTMQAITTIRLLLRRGEIRSVLMVCPKPLVTNWQREFELWAPEIPVMAVEGDQRKREWMWQLENTPVRIANYELLVRDRHMFEPDIETGEPPVSFDLVALDEAQRIKNRSSTTSRVVSAISTNRSWALTGTPVENSSEDLIGIFEFLTPGLLDPEMKPTRMGRTVGDYVLRRTKEKVHADMPPKLFRDADLELSPQQRETYELAETEGTVRLSELGDSLSVQHVFELVLRLKQICNFDPATGESSKCDRLLADMEEIARSGRKAIVFSQWVDTLRRLAKKLEPFGPLEYHGKVPSKKRDDVINQFRDDPSKHVILMSYGAGSVGLNLQFSHYVFLFDRWWNPAVEDQAIGRAHRVGVKSPVTVTRFLMSGTIEERIDRVLNEKRELFETIMDGAEGKRKVGLTQSEILGLFGQKKAA